MKITIMSKILKISEVVDRLLEIKEKYGDLEVRYYDDHASYAPVEAIIYSKTHDNKEVALISDDLVLY